MVNLTYKIEAKVIRLCALVDTLLLDGSVEDYEYLNKSRREVDGIDDHEEWNSLQVVSCTLVFSVDSHAMIECSGDCWF